MAKAKQPSKNGKRMGRPRKWMPSEDDYAKVERFAGLLPLDPRGRNIPALGDLFNVSAATMRNRMLEDPELRGAYQRGRANAVGRMALSLYQQGISGNVTAQIFYLKTQGGWTERTEHHHYLSLVQRLTAMTPEELLELEDMDDDAVIGLLTAGSSEEEQ